MSTAWIFSSNPEKYDLLTEIEAREVRPGAEGRWQANQRRQDMHPGDVVYHWVTGAQSGIYAVSHIIGEPHEAQVPKWPDHHWWIDLRFEQVLSRPVLKADLEAHPLLRGLNILHMPRMTNYLLTPEQAMALGELVGIGKTSPSEDLPLRYRHPRIWKVSAGRGGAVWPQFRDQSLIGIGFSPVKVDPSEFSSLAEMETAAQQPGEKQPSHQAIGQVWTFAREMDIGDTVVIYGDGAVLGIGEITGEYVHRPDEPFQYARKQRTVHWKDLTMRPASAFSAELRNVLRRNLTIVELTEEQLAEISGSVCQQPLSYLSTYLFAHKYHFPPDLLATYYLSLQTKPFAILSGLSGTGKTKLAQLFAEWVGGGQRVILIPVHPDWTDHRGLLGFCHLLTGTYHATDFLRLLLAAHLDWTQSEKKPYFVVVSRDQLETRVHTVDRMGGEKRPYFVVLDEMNLARVEHYFADFLSVLESRRLGDDGAIHQDPFSLHDQPRCLLAAGNEMLAQGFCTADADYKACIVACETCPFQHLVKEEHWRGKYAYDEARKGGFNPLYFVPPRLEVPLNVYFTGTVNVDETTFTFSPKVLDRANVIEFGKVDLEGYWGETGQTGNLSYTCADDSIVRALTHEFTYPFTTGLRKEALQELNLAPYREQLAALVHLLEPFHMHFGYRVADEILVYLLNARCLDDPVFNLDAAFDCAVLQKILPRFHGARARLWQPLLRLLAFCTDDPAATEEQAKMWGEMSVERIREQAGPEPRLPRSTAKLLRMLSDLETEGFTSFT